MAISKQKPAETQPEGIAVVPTPPSPTEEIASLNRALAELQRTHELETARERNLAKRYKDEAEGFKEELSALLESPLMRILKNGENLAEIEDRLTSLCVKCANSETAVKGSMALKIVVISGRSGEGSLNFEIADTVKQPVEDTGACTLWLDRKGKLSESNAKQRELIDVPPWPRRPNPTDEEKMEATE